MRAVAGSAGVVAILILWIVCLAMSPEFGVAMSVGLVLGFIGSHLIDLVPDPW
jgi:hypothetical protein